MDKKKLAALAAEAMKSSYSPYSGFTVGAALLCRSGKVYTGCNIENAAFTPTVCAERVAFFKAISEGERDFTAIAVAGGKNGNIASECPPCGVCRQVMTEFCAPDFEIILVSAEGERSMTLGELMPLSFGAEITADKEN